MRKAFVALLLLAGAAMFSVNYAAAADEYQSDDAVKGVRLATKNLKSEISRAARLGTSTGTGSDTIYIGYTPGNFHATYNYWSVRAHQGVGANDKSPGGQGSQEKGQWSFQGSEAAWSGDSLQGWTPLRMLYGSTAAQTRPDFARPWWAIDIGNNINAAPGGAEGRTLGVVGVWHRDDAGVAVGATLPTGATHGFGTENFHFEESPPGSGIIICVQDPDVNLAQPAWTVIEGSHSAWMGLRAHNDIRFQDPITKNYFNHLGNSFHNNGPSVGGDGTDAGFPGYSSQMDQMLYKDIEMTGNLGASLTVTFSYKVHMSTGIGTALTTRTGWFQHDPLQVTFTSIAGGNKALGNFISSSDAGNAQAPRDSFMVYVGAPTGASFVTSKALETPADLTPRPTDPLRKWFSETIRSVEGKYVQLLSVSGPDNAGTDVSFTIPNAGGARSLTGAGGGMFTDGNTKVRLVFRVKTNRGFDDEGTAYTSSKLGAAQVDKVSYQIGAGAVVGGAWGDFNAVGSIDNSALATAAWRSTGKAPYATGHVDNLAVEDLAYTDLCGNVGSATRICDLSGNVLNFGTHPGSVFEDNSEHPVGSTIPGTADREPLQTGLSPTILLAAPVSGGAETGTPLSAGYNAIGLNAAGAQADEDLYVDMDIYGGTFSPADRGDYWRYYFSNYPAADDYGNACWSGMNPPPYIIFNPDIQCFQDFADHPVKALGTMETSNCSGLPDSVRISVQTFQRCFRDQAPNCAPIDPVPGYGAYYDNISLMLIDGTPQQVAVDLWDFFNDTFPSSETVLAGNKAAFDTAAAVLKIGRNIGNDYVTGSRYSTPGDSVLIHTGPGPKEIHMIFRILPGPGNYVTNGRPDFNGFFNLRQVPTSAAAIVSGNTSNFWSSYIAAHGIQGSVLGHASPGHLAQNLGVWDANVWNSARCDTAEANLFSHYALGVQGPPIDSDYMSTYHEFDFHGGSRGAGGGAAAGLSRPVNVCYIAALAGPVTDVICKPEPGKAYPPAYVAGAGAGTPFAPTGYPGTTVTREYTKIIPDGQLTPGSHVQYFFARYSSGSGTHAVPIALAPDTMTVFPQPSESNSTDAHRWQQVSVLPDAWKTDGHKHPVTGQLGATLCAMLVIDQNDRRGNERVWVSIADTIGATAKLKRGAHNGWSARGGADVSNPDGVGPDGPAGTTFLPGYGWVGFIAEHGGQPGTTWDLYGIKGSESLGTSAAFMGGRLPFTPAGATTSRDPSNTQIFGTTGIGGTDWPGKGSRQAPTPDMLKAYYSILFWMTGDLNSQVLSPIRQRTQDDLSLINDFLGTGSTSSPNRGMYLVGDGVVEDADFNAFTGLPAHLALLNSKFGTALDNPSHATASGLIEPVPDLTTTTAFDPAGAHVYGIRNVCLWTNDVLFQDGVPTGIASRYEGGASYPAGLIHTWSAAQPWISQLDGFDIEHITGINDVSTGGRIDYYFKLLTKVFGNICSVAGTPIGALDVHSRDFGNYVRLANTPLRSGEARIDLSLAKADRVEVKIFDVSGRLVRTLADRMFDAGEHSLRWDGSGNDGRPVSRGVYFTQVKYKNSAFSAARKLTVLN